jgi:hypothetical protein
METAGRSRSAVISDLQVPSASGGRYRDSVTCNSRGIEGNRD